MNELREKIASQVQDAVSDQSGMILTTQEISPYLDRIMKEIHSAIIADREERKLDVDKVSSVIDNYRKSVGSFIFNSEIAKAIVAAFSAPRRVSVEEMELEVKNEWKKYYAVNHDYVMHKTEIECCSSITQAIHSLVYGDAVEKDVCEWKKGEITTMEYTTACGKLRTVTRPCVTVCDCGRKIKV